MPVCWLLTTLTSNPPLYAAPFWTFSCLLAASTSNLPLYAAPFWTSSCLPSTSTSNPSPLPHPFGLPLAYLLPPHRFNVQSTTLCHSLLDFLVPSHHSNVQSDTLSLSFWTSFCLFTGFPPLQRPTCHSMPHPFGLPLAYLLPPHRFNVQSTTLCRSLLDFLLPIYCLPTTSASNPPYSRSPFGLHPAFSPL